MILSNLRVHLSALLALLALILIACRARIRGTVFLGLAAFVLALVNQGIAAASDGMAAAEPDLKIIAFNTLTDNLENGSAIPSFLLASDADLVFLNESGPVVPFLEGINNGFRFQLGCRRADENNGACGDVLVLSCLELEAPAIGGLTPTSGHQTITARVQVDGRPINVVATHLLRPHAGERQIAEFSALSR